MEPRTFGEKVRTAKPAERARLARNQARSALRLQHGLNPEDGSGWHGPEYAYSPSTGAVGMRWEPDGTFKIDNIYYPHHGDNESVTDWVSVGCARPKRSRAV